MKKINVNDVQVIGKLSGGSNNAIVGEVLEMGAGVYSLNDVLEFLNENGFDSNEIQRAKNSAKNDNTVNEDVFILKAFRTYLNKSKSFNSEFKANFGYSASLNENDTAFKSGSSIFNCLVIVKKRE